MTSIPHITRLLAKIQDWQNGHGQAMGRAEATTRLDEAHMLFDEVSNLLADARRTLLQRTM